MERQGGNPTTHHGVKEASLKGHPALPPCSPTPTSIYCRIAIVLDALEKAELTEMTAGSVVPESGVGEDLGQ